MGLWSSIKNAVKKAVKKVVNAVRGIARNLWRIGAEVTHRFLNAVTGIFLWGREKNLRLHFVILHEPGGAALVTEQQVIDSFERAKPILKDRFNTRLSGFGKPFVTTLKEDAPTGALNVECDAGGYFVGEFGEAGAFFGAHLAGWNAVPVTLTYPVTVFVVSHVKEDGVEMRGCSWGILADYVVITAAGIDDDTTLGHEIGHACSLLHRDDKNNLMLHDFPRGTSVTGWQEFWFRGSRHVNFY